MLIDFSMYGSHIYTVPTCVVILLDCIKELLDPSFYFQRDEFYTTILTQVLGSGSLVLNFEFYSIQFYGT